MKVYKFFSYNFKIFKKGEKLFSIEHRGLNYGDGVYETLRVYDGRIFAFKEHIERLKKSLDVVKINFSVNERKIENEIANLLKLNRVKNCAVRIVITRGNGLGLPPPKGKPDISIMLVDIDKKIEEYQKRGIKAILIENPRLYDFSTRGAKTINFLPNVLGSIEFEKNGAQEGIFVTKEGFIAEGTTSNVFFVKDGILKTPSLEIGILAGITRKFILHIAREQKIPFEEGFYKKEELLSAEEVFISSTTREIVPVIQIDDKKIGDRRAGSLTLSLLSAFKKKVLS
jgi:branched-chain amino acid aminotransferase